MDERLFTKRSLFLCRPSGCLVFETAPPTPKEGAFYKFFRFHSLVILMSMVGWDYYVLKENPEKGYSWPVS